jgi:hypothetical protein
MPSSLANPVPASHNAVAIAPQPTHAQICREVGERGAKRIGVPTWMPDQVRHDKLYLARGLGGEHLLHPRVGLQSAAMVGNLGETPDLHAVTLEPA